MDACPDPERIAAYRLGRLSQDGEADLERHALQCASCRELFRVLGHVEVPRRWVSWKAAAALLLLATGWLAWRARPTPPPVHPAAPVASLGLPREVPRSHLRPGLELLLEKNARVTSDGKRLKAEAGNFWVESSGDSVSVDLPGAALTLGRGLLYVSVPAPARSAWILREALAGEAFSSVWVLEGEATATIGGEPLVLRAGKRLLLRQDGWKEESIPSEEVQARLSARAQAAGELPGEPLVADHPVPSVYRWVLVLEGRQAATEVGLTLGVPGGWYRWTLGMASQPPRPRDVVEAVWDGEKLKGRVNGRTLFALTPAELARVMTPVQEEAWSVSVWGGTVTVAQSRLTEAP